MRTRSTPRFIHAPEPLWIAAAIDDFPERGGPLRTTTLPEPFMPPSQFKDRTPCGLFRITGARTVDLLGCLARRIVRGSGDLYPRAASHGPAIAGALPSGHRTGLRRLHRGLTHGTDPMC